MIDIGESVKSVLIGHMNNDLGVRSIIKNRMFSLSADDDTIKPYIVLMSADTENDHSTFITTHTTEFEVLCYASNREECIKMISAVSGVFLMIRRTSLSPETDLTNTYVDGTNIDLDEISKSWVGRISMRSFAMTGKTDGNH